MASSIFFNGRVISVPGSYSEVDASGLEQVGLGAAGIVAVIGTAEGGTPVSAISEPSEFIRITKPEAARNIFRSGDLREVAEMLFAPGKDADILGGAVEVVAMKANPATAATATVANANGNVATFTARDYGEFTNQINITIGSGTVQGKLLTITFEDSVESVDDLGGDDFFNLKYVKPTGGWDTMTAQVIAGGLVQCLGTRDVGGLDGDVTLQLSGNSAVEVASADAGDVGNLFTVYGLDDTGAAVKEVLTLNGTTTVVGTQTFSLVTGCVAAGTAGVCTLKVAPGGATVLTVAADSTAGIHAGVAMYAAGVLTLVSDGVSTKVVVVEGTNASGASVLEKFTLTGTTAVVGTGVFSSVTRITAGDVEAAQTLTVSATAAKSTTTQNTMQKLADFFNAKYVAAASGGFVFTLNTTQTTLNPSNLDVTTAAVNALSPADPGFKADLYTMVNWVNLYSQLTSAEVVAGASGGAPDNTTAPVFLAGGGEGTTQFANWQAALNLLKKVRVNTIVVLTGDPAVHAALDAHCAYMGGIGRSERDGVVGLLNAGLTDVPSKTEIKDQVTALNTRHVRAVAQSIERYNTAGERQVFLPPFHAAIIAGMQAGSPVGTSLTHKYMNVLSLKQDTSWNPTDDAEEMIQAGLCFGESIDGSGRRVVRNITTHLSSNNTAFVEASVNEAVNFAVYNFRTNLEVAVGKRGFAGTVNAAKGVALGTLGLLKDENIITASRSLDIELVVDVLETSVEIAPVLPINFVKTTIHLVTVPQAAA